MRLRTLLPTALIAALAVLVMTGPAWALAFNDIPAPAVGGLAGAAIIGAIVIAKLWRRK